MKIRVIHGNQPQSAIMKNKFLFSNQTKTCATSEISQNWEISENPTKSNFLYIQVAIFKTILSNTLQIIPIQLK